MNMEIKLLKEKQAQSDGNSLWGILNRSNEPMLKNLMDSNQKYQCMKKSTDGTLHVLFYLWKTTEYHNLQLADQQNAVIKKMNYLEQKIEKLQNDKNESDKNAAEKKDKIGRKV